MEYIIMSILGFLGIIVIIYSYFLRKQNTEVPIPNFRDSSIVSAEEAQSELALEAQKHLK